MRVKALREFFHHYQPINNNSGGDGVTNWGRIGIVPQAGIETSMELFEADQAIIDTAEAAGKLIVLEVLDD